MASAIDFLPRVISTLTNLATSWLLYFGSGSVSRFGTSLRRGITLGSWDLVRPALGGLRFLGAVFGTALFAIFHALRVEAAAHHVVAHTGEILHPAATNQHHGVLLQVMAFAADIADDFETVGEPHLCHFPQGRVRLLRRRGVDAGAYTTFLRGPCKRGPLAFGLRQRSGLAD